MSTTTSPVPSLGKSSGLDLRPVACLLLITLPFWIAVTCPFLGFDDPSYVSQNTKVLGGLNFQSIRWAFTTTTGGFWIPMTWLSLMLDASLWGASPAGFHVTNILLHLANAILIYFLLDTLTRARGKSLLVAALFAIHPLRVESVAWITERKDVLALFFGLLAMLMWIRHIRIPSPHRYFLTCLLFALSIMAKPMLVTLPFILLLLDYWPLERLPTLIHRRTLSLLIEKIPFFAVSAAACIINYVIQVRDHSLVGGTDNPLPLRLQNALVNAVLYLRDTFYFRDLSILYPLPHALAAWQIITATAVLLTISAAILPTLKKHPACGRPLLIGWLWFLGALVPFLGIIQSGAQARADRFSYFPSIGLFIALVWAFSPIQSKIRNQKSKILLSAAILLALAYFTTSRLLLWRDPLQLYLDGIAHTQNNVRLEVLTATLLRDRNQLPEARQHYLAAMQISPKDPEIVTMMALLYVRAGRLDLALPYFRQAYQLAPADPAFADNYHQALAQLRKQSATGVRP